MPEFDSSFQDLNTSPFLPLYFVLFSKLLKFDVQPEVIAEKDEKRPLNPWIGHWPLLAVVALPVVLSVCPLAEDIPPPICAFLFDDDECSDTFYAIKEDSQEMEIDKLVPVIFILHFAGFREICILNV